MATADVKSLIYLGIKGSVVALDRRTGVEYWRTALKGGDFVNVVYDHQAVYATARGEIFCLDPAIGSIRWHNPLKGMGWGMITIAGDSIAPMAYQRMVEGQRAAAAASSTH
jgi:outer membrane protein assembly factor BamB